MQHRGRVLDDKVSTMLGRTVRIGRWKDSPFHNSMNLMAKYPLSVALRCSGTGKMGRLNRVNDLKLTICGLLEQKIEPWNNSVSHNFMVKPMVIRTRIEYIYSVMYKVDAVNSIVVLLHNWQKELPIPKKILVRKL